MQQTALYWIGRTSHVAIEAAALAGAVGMSWLLGLVGKEVVAGKAVGRGISARVGAPVGCGAGCAIG